MRYLLRLLPKGSRTEFLSSVRSLAKSVGAEARNPKWTSYGALEIDIFTQSRSDFDLLLPILEPISKLEFEKDLNVAPPHKSEEDLLTEAWSYFNGERYWECHEVLEGIWRTKQGAEKSYLQGLILVCAAYVHHQKGEADVALSVLARASKQLHYSEPGYHGIDVRRLEEQVLSILKTRDFQKFDL